jgi:DNA-binding CsgD family transcriptional regulator
VAKRISRGDCDKDRAEAGRYHAESFPSFDLSVLTPKQLDVLVMRYRGLLSFRKIAAFEGVWPNAIVDRHAAALRKLKAQLPYHSREGVATAASERAGIERISWEELGEAEAQADEAEDAESGSFDGPDDA